MKVYNIYNNEYVFRKPGSLTSIQMAYVSWLLCSTLLELRNASFYVSIQLAMWRKDILMQDIPMCY